MCICFHHDDSQYSLSRGHVPPLLGLLRWDTASELGTAALTVNYVMEIVFSLFFEETVGVLGEPRPDTRYSTDCLSFC